MANKFKVGDSVLCNRNLIAYDLGINEAINKRIKLTVLKQVNEEAYLCAGVRHRHINFLEQELELLTPKNRVKAYEI